MVRNRKGKPFVDPHVKYAEEVDKAVYTFNEEMRDGTSVEAARHFGEKMADLRDMYLHVLFGPALTTSQVLRFYDRNACKQRRAERVQADKEALLKRIGAAT